jgi:predicted TIM-barrel fold metal-dependent hydrolase
MFKVDVFPHILPPKFMAALDKKATGKSWQGSSFHSVRQSIYDMDARFRIMDKYENYVQILNLAIPPVEDVAPPKVAAELAQIANDEMAELVFKYPDRFVAAVACLPMNDIDAALKEIDRAVLDLRFRGIQIYSNIQDKALDSPEFEPIFAKMVEYDLPILIHPRHRENGRLAFDYFETPDETEGEHWGRSLYNWPFETTIALCALVYGGIMQKYPNLKIVSHHCGGTLPFQAHRILCTTETRARGSNLRKSTRMKLSRYFTKKPYDYAKLFYGDTACYGNTGALMCGHYFFGADHMLFGTDMPFDSEGGNRYIRETIRSVDEMNITAEERKKIYEDNARKLFRLPF